MPNKRKTSIDCTHLLNFQTNLPPDLQSSASVLSSRRNQNRKNSNNYYNREHDQKKQAAQREENWARQKLQSSFYLRSSASHSFIVKRTSVQSSHGKKLACAVDEECRYLKLNGLSINQNSNLADGIVDWDVVKAVRVQVPTSQNEVVNPSIPTCSICLNELIAPRSTNCLHVFCFSCILRHFHVANKGNAVGFIAKCPCCSNYISLSDMRPVEFVTVQSPFSGGGSAPLSISMTFQKCHRKKNGLVPYLPFQTDTTKQHNNNYVNQNDENNKSTSHLISIRKRDEPNDIPSVKSSDAPYCRFNYMDISTHIRHLQNDLTSLRNDMETIDEMYKNLKGSSMKHKDDMNNNDTNLDKYFISMSLEAVQAEYDAAVSLSDEQTKLTNEQESRYANINKVKVAPYSFINGDGFCCKLGKKARSNSIDSIEKENESKSQKKKAKSRPRSKSMQLIPGTTYLDDDCVQFYQAIDGQLCFLCGFNLKCLAYEFMDKDLSIKSSSEKKKIGDNGVSSNKSASETNPVRPPFPDSIHGQIVDVQTVHLTPEVRRRMAFTSHLPLYIDINLVEINLTQYLSPKTQERFRCELEQRKKKRQAQRNSERKAKKKAEREEHERIERLKQGMQRIDINDEFFHAPSAIHQDEDFTGDAFGPSILSSQVNSYSAQSAQAISHPNSIHRTYGSVCASNGFFPQLDATNDSVFPSLGSSASRSSGSSSSSSINPVKTNNYSGQSSKGLKTQSTWATKSKKKDKVLLFSSGARRSYA